jgi:hypothetical protein
MVLLECYRMTSMDFSLSIHDKPLENPVNLSGRFQNLFLWGEAILP